MIFRCGEGGATRISFLRWICYHKAHYSRIYKVYIFGLFYCFWVWQLPTIAIYFLTKISVICVSQKITLTKYIVKNINIYSI